RPDLRGAAGSSERGPVGMDAWCEQIAALLDGPAIIAGHCLGANIALNFAARYPQRVAGLVLIEPMPPEALTGQLGVLRRLRFAAVAASLLVRAANALGIYRRRIEAMDLEAWDKAVRAGTSD